MAKTKAYNDMSELAAKGEVAAPVLAYEPPRPRKYNPPIALIGCGGISESHLKAYKAMGLNVVALCDVIRERAESRQKAFYPDAEIYTDYKLLLKRDDVEVVDIPTHPQDREYLVPAVLQARKHVLSQKPFVLDLDRGDKFTDLADKMGVTLAVNQNGRWSPHWSWVRHAVQKKLIGDVNSIHMNVQWNHQWIVGTPFNRVHHIVLYDFAIHWFDALASLVPGLTAKRVCSSLGHAQKQSAMPPLLASSIVEFDGCQAVLGFNGAVDFAGRDVGTIAGSKGTLRYQGDSLDAHQVSLTTKAGTAKPDLKGTWFFEGFQGSMGELLNSIEKKRVPVNNARDNLRGLAICFAAVASAESNRPEVVGKVRKVPLATCMVAPEK